MRINKKNIIGGVNNCRKKARLFISAILIITMASAIVYYSAACRKLSYEYFYEGVYIDGVNVAGLTKAGAFEKLEADFKNNYRQSSVELISDNSRWTLSLDSINFRFDFQSSIDNAYRLGRTGNWVHRISTIRSLAEKPVNFVVTAQYDKARLYSILSKIKKQIDFSGSNSTYEYNYGKIVYTKDINGTKMDIETNTRLIEAKLLNRDFSDICLDVEVIRPMIAVGDVKELKDVLSVFTTRFNSNNYSRAHNIELAGNRINNYLLLPGEEFSMDCALGPRTSSNGYMQAPIIMRSQFVAGTGGGVCQVATTLYNAVLLSCLEVTKRVHHSIPLGYVPPGQDATISEGYIDLKFKNNRDYTICIVSEVKDGTVTVKIIGRKRAGETVNTVLRPVVMEEYAPPEPEYVVDSSLADQQVRIRVKERKGLKVILYRDSYNVQGALTNSEIISEDIYKPVRGQLAVNRKTFDSLRSN
ncbi:vancomycin B-type resistance protein VanW [Ruminiclostridium hungatei]|uniref:Vancomycin B-type resistance protein VanW n=1 Tax=Ruminiclostridium hungatei TaxID=48256 RepID=A0A1V4SKG5_RUMHU|nr:VanW family protein [Ruminiclostridium hungatei]OPX43727.1 vancomycin B-type resistance protein VanW [Ruminiclostridium hungatei]